MCAVLSDRIAVSNREPVRPRIAYVVTDSVSIDLLGDQLSYLGENGFSVWVLANPGPRLSECGKRYGVTPVGIPMVRPIRPVQDFRSLLRLVATLRRLRPDIVYVGTPKASLLGMVASALAGVPIRIFAQWGLRLETTRGLLRWILLLSEWLTARCSTRILYVSHSLREVYEGMGLAPTRKGTVLLEGSSKGVDILRFASSSGSLEAGRRLRAQLGISPTARVAGFVGRLTRDKGIEDLARAFFFLEDAHPDLHILLVGGFEAEDRPAVQVIDQMQAHPRIHFAGAMTDVAPAYHAMDFLVLPSYREGFPNVVLEASAANLPTIGYRSTGVRDAVIDGVTGTLIDVGDVEGLARAIARYAGDPALCERQGQAAFERVERSFAQEKVFKAIADFYRDALAAHPDTAHLLARLGPAE